MSPWDIVASKMDDIAGSKVIVIISLLWLWSFIEKTKLGILISLAFERTFGGLINMILLGQNVDLLNKEVIGLRLKKENLEMDVEAKEKEDPQLKRTPSVQSWMESVENIIDEALIFRRVYKNEPAISIGWHRPCSMLKRFFSLGRQVVELQKCVEKLKKEKDELCSPLVTKAIPLEPIEILRNTTRDILDRGDVQLEICGHILDPMVAMIGIYGMSGVGKTTILKKINNDLLDERTSNKDLVQMFDLVVWVEISQNWSLESVQEDILGRLKLCISEGEKNATHRRNTQAKTLWKFLSKRRFLLFLDDMWGKVDLDDVGIPLHSVNQQYKSKVVFATRDGSVCKEMRCDRTVYIPTLDEKQSWELFCLKTKPFPELNHPPVRNMVEKMVSGCAGLPVAIDVIADAATKNTNANDWKDASWNLQKLTNKLAAKVDGMDRVFSCLKLSFDRLASEPLPSCFLYCCLYQEDFYINKKDLVWQWICEGLLKEEVGEGRDLSSNSIADIDRLQMKGHQIVQRLQDACLLESVKGEYCNEYRIKMHALVREMALQVMSTGGVNDMGMLLVDTGRNINNEVEVTNAHRRVSLDGCKVNAPIKISSCSHLETLIVCRTDISNWNALNSSLAYLRCLKVLDLTASEIEVISASISVLVNLRYLNLSWTKVRALPKEVGELENLKLLNLSCTQKLDEIPKEAVIRLSSLEKLSVTSSAYRWDSNLRVTDLKGLRQLRDFDRDPCTFEELKVCKEMAFVSVIKGLKLTSTPNMTTNELCNAIIEMENLEHLWFSGISYLSGTLKIPEAVSPWLKLKHLRIGACENLENITGLYMLRDLEKIVLYRCDSITSLVAEEVNDKGGAFRSLKHLDLDFLPALKSISSCQLSWPSLRTLEVGFGCDELKELPFGSCSAPHMMWIKGYREWWDKLSWESGDTKNRFARYFRES